MFQLSGFYYSGLGLRGQRFKALQDFRVSRSLGFGV